MPTIVGLRNFMVAAALATIAMGPAAALTLRDVEVICPLDGRKFMHKAINSYTQFGVRLDMRPHGALMAPAPLPVCPDSGFVVYRNEFTSDELVKLKAIAASAEYREMRNEHTDYFIWAYLEIRMGSTDRWKLANIYLRAAWQAEGGPEARRHQYLALARDNFAAAAGTLEKDSVNDFTARLLVAELERLLGRFDAAQTVLDRFAGAPFPDKPPFRLIHRQIAQAVAERDAKPRNFIAK